MQDQNNQTTTTEVRVVKCKPGQGKLNRLIAKAQDKLRTLGYPERRFKRDYEAGTASYVCPLTGATALVNIKNKQIVGTCFGQTCSELLTQRTEQKNG